MQESSQYIISENLTTTELSIIVPVFNAENNICDFLARLEEIVSLLSLSYEIIVVNDGRYLTIHCRYFKKSSK